MAEVTWLGDEDPSVQSIEQYGHTFAKGEPTTVPEKDRNLAKFKGNAFFHVEADKDASDGGESKPAPKVKAKQPVAAPAALATQKADENAQ